MEWADWARAVFALTATIALIGLAAFAARRFGFAQAIGPRAERRMQVIERLLIDPRRQLILVRVDEEEHLLVLTMAGARLLTTRPVKP